mgnify:CR=1 FL=1
MNINLLHISKVITIIIVLLTQIAGCSTNYKELAEEHRIESIWQSSELTYRGMVDKEVPYDWDAGVYLSSGTIQNTLNSLVGTKITVQNINDFEGWFLLVDKIELNTKNGFSLVDLELTLFDDKHRKRY